MFRMPVPPASTAAVAVALAAAAGHGVAEALDGLGDSDAGRDGTAALLVALGAPGQHKA